MTIPGFARRRPRGLRLAATLMLALLAETATAQSPMALRYRVIEDTDLRVEMDPQSQVVGRLARGTAGLRLLWCEPAIPVADWQDSDPQTRRRLLDQRWCEVETPKAVGNVAGRVLAPE